MSALKRILVLAVVAIIPIVGALVLLIALALGIGPGRLRVGEAAVGAGRDAGLGAKVLGEAL